MGVAALASAASCGSGADPETGSTPRTTGAASTEVAVTDRSEGHPLDTFPYEIDVEAPHRPHIPVTDFATTARRPDGGLEFTHPVPTSPFGLYGRWWRPSDPPAPHARLAGVRFRGARWTGDSGNTFVVYSLIDGATEDCARGTIVRAVEGLPNELCAVDASPSGQDIELRLARPVPARDLDVVAVIDTENLPQGDLETVYPDSVSVDRIEWLWELPTLDGSA